MKLSTLEIICNALNVAKVRFIVVGGIAVNTYGYQRMTSDLDIVIQLRFNNIISAMTTLKSLGYTPIVPETANDFANPDKRNEWITTKNMQVLSLQSNQHPDTSIDIFVTEPFNFEDEYSQATTAEITPDISFKIVSINTLIKMKAKANRAKDIDDINHLKLILNEKNYA